MKGVHYIVLGAWAFILNGCSTIAPNEVFQGVRQEAALRGIDHLVWIKSHEDAKRLDETLIGLLRVPLSQENAVRIAMINNRKLQQTYEEIGLSHSELIQAGLMSNPLLGYSVGRGGGKTTTTWSLDIAFLDLLWIPLRQKLGGIALEETKLRVGDEVLKIARDTKKSYIDARVAHEQAVLYQNFLKSTEASLQLAVRQYTAGNLSKRDYLKVKDLYAHARIEAIRLNRESAIARETLNRLMGLFGDQTAYAFSSEPLSIPSSMIDLKGLENAAITNRLDMAAALKGVDYAAQEAGYTESTRFLSEAEIFAESEKTTDESRFTTFGLKIPIPIFDFGQARVSKTQAQYNQSVHRLYETAVNIRSQVREGYATYRYGYDIANEYKEVITPTNQQILEETQLFYNGMLEGIYHLLEDQRRVVEIKMEGLRAVGEYHKAASDLEYILGGKL